VKSPLQFAVGAAAGLLLVRGHRQRASAERLAAALLETLLNAIDATDPDTGSHVRRVARYTSVLADAADLPVHERHDTERVALFHDIGKIHEALFDIIHDHDALSPEEREAIATHPQKGADVLAPLDRFYPTLSEGVLSHHERWDGTGYPRKLSGEEIPVAARIVALADTLDAITHSRRYRAGRSLREAAILIAEGRGTQFDPDLTDLFLSPPVLDEIDAAMREALAPPTSRAHGERRHGGTGDAPDVKFRWRSATPEQPVQAIPRRTRRE
jgi:HD-GYP domain-containing protein (c-di-GMP phosphodiesterase class II)